MDHCPPKIANGVKALLEIADPEYARPIAYQNAREILKVCSGDVTITLSM